MAPNDSWSPTWAAATAGSRIRHETDPRRKRSPAAKTAPASPTSVGAWGSPPPANRWAQAAPGRTNAVAATARHAAYGARSTVTVTGDIIAGANSPGRADPAGAVVRRGSGDVEPVEVHHLVPGSDEVADELARGVVA